MAKSLKEKMQSGMVFTEWHHTDPEDQKTEQELFAQRQLCKKKCFEYNNTDPLDVEKKRAILDELLGSHTGSVWMEAPIHFAYGSNIHVGNGFYANFNFTVIDDGEVHIGDKVLIGPNVTISVTGHPIDPEIRNMGCTHYCIPVNIGSNVWIGAGVIINPGVTIGDNCVIGAGSVVTRDIPSGTIAMGVPCRVVREIGPHDKEYYWRDRKFDWEEGF